MRTLSIVFFVATAVVFAASQSLPQPSDNDVFDMNSFGAIQEKIEDVLELLKCARVVVGDAIGESELKTDFQQFAHQVDQIIKKELPLCRAAGGKDVYKCLLVNGQKIGQYFYEFVKKVSEENKDIAKKIHNDFQQICMKKPNLFFVSESTFNLGDQFQCIVDAITEASKANGLTDVWSQTQPKLKGHLDSWKQCDNAGSKLKIVFCNIKEGAYVYALVFRYIASISKNPNFTKFAQDFNKIAQQKCASHALYYIANDDDLLDKLLATEEQTEPWGTDPIEPTETETPTKPPTKAPTKAPTKPTKSTQSPPIHGVWARIKCTIKSISAGVKDTDFALVWENYMKEFRAIESRIKVCKTKGIWQRTKCTLKEYRNASRNLRNFLRQFKLARRESYKRMLKFIWKRCV